MISIDNANQFIATTYLAERLKLRLLFDSLKVKQSSMDNQRITQ